MSADNLRENTRTENPPSDYEAFIMFLETFGYGYESRKGSDGFEEDNDKFRQYIVNYIKSKDKSGKIESPEIIANKVFNVIFLQFSKGNIKSNFLRKIIEDQQNEGNIGENAELYAAQLISALFGENSQTLDENQVNYLKNKFNAYWKTITAKVCSKLIKVVVPIDPDPVNPEPKPIIDPVEELISKEYFEIYRKCLSKHLPELKKKFFRNLREDYFSILIRRYFSKELTAQDEININPEEFIKNKNFVFRTIEWIWSGFGLKAKDYQRATGELMRSHDDTREKAAGYLGITINDFDNKVSKAKSFLAEKMQNCLELNKKK